MTEKKSSLFIPIIDNGLGLSRTSWAVSMCSLFMSDVLKGRQITVEAFSYPYPDGILNICTATFLQETDLEAMLIIDTDLQFHPEHVRRLLSHDVPLVAGLYPLKQPGLIFPVVPLEDNPMPFSKAGPTLCEVECAPRGFMRINRSVFEALKDKVPEYLCGQTKRKQHEYWRNQMGGNSEDFNFCRLYRSIGGKILIDKTVCVQHIGSVTYPISENAN